MKRAKKPTFIVELPLAVTLGDERILLARFESARRLYNAVLGEGLRRQKLMRESKRWQAAKELRDKDERSKEFKQLCSDYSFTSASLSSFGTNCKNAARWDTLLGAHDTQKISERAFNALEQYGYGKRGRPRFKGKNRPIHSVESKSNVSGIRWQKDCRVIKWNGLVIPAMIAPNYHWQHEALMQPTKYCRIVWRNMRGKRRWYVQLMQEGMSPREEDYHVAFGKVVGLDVGPSTVAVVSQDTADLVSFCPTVEQPWKKMRRLQRKMDRSRRATNPDCFNPDGTWKKGTRQKVFSSRYKSIRSELSEVERVLASERKRSHGEMSNAILSHGNIIQSERLSYRAFQKRYGRSVKRRAPAMFMNLLKRKAESAGGEFRELDTQKLKLSQYDHLTGSYEKKPLSCRWHSLGDGSGIVQRDVYSAFLARCVLNDQHHPATITTLWTAQEPVLRRAGWLKTKSASGIPAGIPTVHPSEWIVRRRRLAVGHGPDDVAAMREPGNPNGFAFRTPRL